MPENLFTGWTLHDLEATLWALGIDIGDVPDELIRRAMESALWPEDVVRTIQKEMEK